MPKHLPHNTAICQCERLQLLEGKRARPIRTSSRSHLGQGILAERMGRASRPPAGRLAIPTSLFDRPATARRKGLAVITELEAFRSRCNGSTEHRVQRGQNKHCENNDQEHRLYAHPNLRFQA